MTMIAELKKLPVDEKLQLVFELWDDIAANPDQIPIPEWHRKELSSLLQQYKQDPDAGDSWAVVKKRVLASL